jgi:hypothetical protein
MKLMTNELAQKLPPLGATKGMAPEKIKVPAKFFDSESRLAFFPVEYDPKTRKCYGLVAAYEWMLAHFSLDELESVETVKSHVPFHEASLAFVQSELLRLRELAGHICEMAKVSREKPDSEKGKG